MLPGKCMGKTHTVVAADVTAGTVSFEFGDWFTVAGAIVNVRTSAGVAKSWDGAVSVSGSTVTVDNSGATDWAAGDVLTVVAFG